MIIAFENKHPLIEKLRIIQHEPYEYKEFIKELKRRIRLYTGKTEVSFYNEKQLVEILKEMGIIRDHKKGGK